MYAQPTIGSYRRNAECKMQKRRGRTEAPEAEGKQEAHDTLCAQTETVAAGDRQEARGETSKVHDAKAGGKKRKKQEGRQARCTMRKQGGRRGRKDAPEAEGTGIIKVAESTCSRCRSGNFKSSAGTLWAATRFAGLKWFSTVDTSSFFSSL